MGGDYDYTLNFARNTTSSRLFLTVLFSYLAVVGSGSVAVGDLLNAPNGVAGAADDAGYGVRFFGEEQVRFYTGDGARLGRADQAVFFSPVEDMAVVRNAADAARHTGMAPSVTRAYVEGGEIFGIAFPTKGMKVRLPTAADAGGWPHFLEGGRTAVRLPNNGGYLVNPTREFVTSGVPVPKGSVLFKLGPNGEWIIVRRF